MTTARRSSALAPSAAATSFTVRGSRNGSLVQVTWDRGTLSGDFPTCDLVEVHAEVAGEGLADGHFRTHVSALYGTLPEHPLSDPVATYQVMTRVFDTIREVVEH